MCLLDSGDDGKEYRWCLWHVPRYIFFDVKLKITNLVLSLQLILSNGFNTVIATGKGSRMMFGVLPSRPQGQHMADKIVVMFTYIERIQKVSQRA